MLLPLLGLGSLMLLAPPLPSGPKPAAPGETRRSSAEPFTYQSDQEAFALDLDPRRVRFDLLEGWDREDEAFNDRNALAFVSGPMYEQLIEGGREHSVPLGDLKLGQRVWRSHNRSAALERAYMGIRHDGRVDFGYGELTPEREMLYDTFIGGLHAIYNQLESPPPQYKGAYSIGMGQRIRYFLPRIRLVYGLRRDGQIEILMSRDGLTLEQTRALAEERQLVAAYLPDHASKSRLIVPGVKGFSQEDANWISGGATSFVHVPYMLRLSLRRQPLDGSPLAGITTELSHASCGNPLACGSQLTALMMDRALAGFNRLMERGVEPLARLIWAPRVPRQAGRSQQHPPLREPVITADPRSIQLRQEQELATPTLPPPTDNIEPAASEATTPAAETPGIETTPQAVTAPAPESTPQGDPKPSAPSQATESKPGTNGAPAPAVRSQEPAAAPRRQARPVSPPPPVSAPPALNPGRAAAPRLAPPPLPPLPLPPLLPPPPLP